ncbi:MAG: hypothetical protein ABII68_05695 [Pseudomonadota bacterium]
MRQSFIVHGASGRYRFGNVSSWCFLEVTSTNICAHFVPGMWVQKRIDMENK